MPWFRQPHHILSQLLGFGTTVWLCRKVGCWASSFGRLGTLVLRLVHRERPPRRTPDYGHLLLDPLYPGRRPSAEASARARELAEESRSAGSRERELQLLGQAVLLSPCDAALYLARAEAYLRWAQPVDALDDADLCVSLDPSSVDGWLVKGRAERALGRTADAALSLQAGLRLQPEHSGLMLQLAQVRAEPAPSLMRQLWDLVAAARLGLENLFRTVEDPEKTTDAFVESNSERLDAQLSLLAQTLRVNLAVLLDSPMLGDVYEQIVYACAQLVAGAPAAFSTRLQSAPRIVEGLGLALRVGWHLHHSAPKLAANALVALATCPTADDALRRQAVRHLLGGMLRWLLDARPEPDREGEEICGCSCSVPWKAAACFLERFFEPGRPLPWVKEECEAWPDVTQLCQWLTLSVRDYHATPLGLVGLLQLPGVAQAAMQSQAVVNLFIPMPLPEDLDAIVADLDAAEPSEAHPPNHPAVERLQSEPPAPVPEQHSLRLPGPPLGGEESVLPPAQRLGEWLMASLGYLFLFIEGDVLFSVSACRALQAMAAADPEGRGVDRLLESLWLGVPLLNKLSLMACSHTAALDLLQHCIFCSSHRSVRVAARSLAHALARRLPGDEIAGSGNSAISDAAEDAEETTQQQASGGGTPLSPTATAIPPAGVIIVATGPAGTAVSTQTTEQHFIDDQHLEEDAVPSWAEFYHELLNELGVPPVIKDDAETLVTLANFEQTAPLLAEHAHVCIVSRSSSPNTDAEHGADAPLAPVDCIAVPAAWNRFTDSVLGNQDEDAVRLALIHVAEDDVDIGTEEYVNDPRKRGQAVLISRRSIRQSTRVQNWAQAVSAAEEAGAAAVIVFNNLDGMEPFRMGLFGELAPSIPAFMVSGAHGSALTTAAASGCSVWIHRSLPNHQQGAQLSGTQPLPWPLTGGRFPADVAQAWSLLEALSAHEPDVQTELESLLDRMNVPEKRVWLTRRLVRHHRSQQAPDGGLQEPPLAFVEGDRSLPPRGQLTAVRRQMCEVTGLGAEDLCGEFEVRFKDEQGVGSAVMREWIDMVARETFLQPSHRLLRSYDGRQTFWPDPAAPFCNPHWRIDYEGLGRLLGLALWHSCTLDLPLHPHVCALLFGFDRTAMPCSSLAEVDDELERTKVRWLLAHPVAELGFDMPFSDSLGSDDVRQDSGNSAVGTAGSPSASSGSLPALVRRTARVPGDARIWPGDEILQVGAAEVALSDGDSEELVTDANKGEFVKRLTEWRLFGAIEHQIEAMRVGLRRVVPEAVQRELRSLLPPTELARLLSGLGEIDVDDWERHCAYAQGLQRDSAVVTWFWRTVRDWSSSPDEIVRLPQLLQFVTGSARVPVGGFSELVGFNGAKHPFTLSKASYLLPQSLPMAHACICTLDLPPYEDFETCQAKLNQMLLLGRAHFDEAAGHSDD